MHRFRALCTLTLALILNGATLPSAKGLDIYFIDADGGQSTLIVTPAGESLLIDTGYAGFDGRHAKRILAAARDRGVSRIDYLLMTHFHPDHDGGIVDLAGQIPIRSFVDHGGLSLPDAKSDPQWPQVSAAFAAYAAIRAKGTHVEPKPGDRLPLKEVEVEVVSSDRATIAASSRADSPRNGACGASAPPPAEAIENPRSTGVHLRFGRFRFIDLGDLTGEPLFALLCPTNVLGDADVYLVPHHGNADAVYPATFAIHPRVAVLNNGATKGGAPEAFTALRHAQQSGQGLEDVWQLQRSTRAGAQNFPDDRIANLDATTGYWIKVSANKDGSFSVTNGRTGRTKHYPINASSRRGSR